MRNDAVTIRTRLCIQPVCQSLPHPGVDERVAGAAALPGADEARIRVRPGEPVEGAVHVLRVEVLVPGEEVVVELAPAELGEELLLDRGRGLRPPHPMPQLVTGADLTELEMRGEARRGLRCGEVALVGVALEPVVQEVVEPLVGAPLAGHPRLAEAGGPVEVGRQQSERLDRLRGDRIREDGELGRRRMGGAGFAPPGEGAEEGVKTPNRSPSPVSTSPGSCSSEPVYSCTCAPCCRAAAVTASSWARSPAAYRRFSARWPAFASRRTAGTTSTGSPWRIVRHTAPRFSSEAASAVRL